MRRRHGTGVAFNRDRRRFSDRDHAIVDLVTPHLAQALDRRARIEGLRLVSRQVARQAVEIYCPVVAGRPVLGPDSGT